MQTRDERRARASQSTTETDETIEELRDDDDVKAKVSVERITVQEI